MSHENQPEATRRLPNSLSENQGPSLLRRSLFSEASLSLWKLFARGGACILMLHRFSDSSTGAQGLNPQLLADNLELLRRQRFHLTSLREVLRRLECGEPIPPRTVVFTIDDGYRDALSVGAEVFAQYDCPATVFLVSGFVDGECWMWEDVLRFIVSECYAKDFDLTFDDGPLSLRWTTESERRQVEQFSLGRLRLLPTPVRESHLAECVSMISDRMPERPPACYAPISWDEARDWEARGIDFGPHTRTHPLLTVSGLHRVSDEVDHSWARLRTELSNPLEVFCYPYGMQADFGDRERGAVRAAGLKAAVRAFGGVCGQRSFAADPYGLPRIAYEEAPHRFRQLVGGAEHVKRWATYHRNLL